jgi:hypothetical protein
MNHIPRVVCFSDGGAYLLLLVPKSNGRHTPCAHRAMPIRSTRVYRKILQSSRATLATIYEAISYVWGNATKPRTIKIGRDSAEQVVTENCYGVLRQVRYPMDERLVWIDALCINQSDDEEKTEQVRRMGEVYAQAKQVIVYLGRADASKRAFLGLINET